MKKNSPTISYHRSYLGKTRWTKEELVGIKDTLLQLHNDPDTPGLDLKPIQGAKPLWSVRVNGGIRMVLYKWENDAANDIIALRVGRKPNIHNWAKRNNRRGKLSSLIAQGNLEPYQPESEEPSDFLRARTDGSTAAGHIDIRNQAGKPKPRSGSHPVSRRRRDGDDHAADSSSVKDHLLDAALDVWQEPVADVSAINSLNNVHGGPVLVLGTAGTDKQFATMIRSLYMAEKLAEDDEHILLLTDSVHACETFEQFLERATEEEDLQPTVEAVKVWHFDDWLQHHTQELTTWDDACCVVRQRLEDGSLSPATAGVVVHDSQNLGPQAVSLCRALALATVPKHERWRPTELERLCLVADPFQRTDHLRLNIQECDVKPAKTIRLRQSGVVTQAVIDVAVSALKGQEFDDLTGGIASTDGYRSLEAGEKPAFRRCANLGEGARQVADWLREVQEADAEPLPGRFCLVARTNSRLKDWRKALRKRGVKTRRLRLESDPASSTDKVWVAKPEDLDPEMYFRGIVFLDADRKSWPRRKILRQAVDETDRDAVELRERSLFYLACTRARRHLLFCSRGSFAPWLEELAPPAPVPKAEVQSPAQPPARIQAMKYPVLIDQEITDAMLQVLHDRGCDTYDWNPGGETPRMEETVGFFVYGHALIDGPIMDQMPKLKVISNMGVGVDHIRIPDATERGIAVGNTPGFVDGATADMAFLLMMAIARNLKKGMDYARGPEFRHFDPTLWHGREINGATLGIYGMGAIGSTVARRAAGFNMHVIYHNRNRLSDTREAELNAYWVPRSSLLARSDFLLLSLPLSEETEGCMGLAEFRQMQNDAFLINIARGGLVRTEELVTALEEGQLAGAALDVTEPEPLPRDHPLVEHPDVIITPHLGSATVETREGMFIRTLENLMAGMQDKPLLNQVLQ